MKFSYSILSKTLQYLYLLWLSLPLSYLLTTLLKHQGGRQQCQTTVEPSLSLDPTPNQHSSRTPEKWDKALFQSAVLLPPTFKETY